MVIQKDLSYDPQVPARKFDLFLPASDTPRPLVVMLHGGGWISGHRSMYHDEAAWYAQHGYAAACVGYRLAPLNPFPDPIADVQTFLTFARENGRSLGFDPDQIITLGNSAGAHLSCMLGLAPKNLKTGEPASRADAFVSISAISDLRNPDTTHFPVALSFLEQFIGASPYELPESYEAASPLVYVDKTAPPSLLIHGEADEIVPVEQTKKLYTALTQAGAPTEMHLLPHQAHSFTLDAWNHIRRLSLEFIESL